MRSDDHQSFQRRIDETLAGKIAVGEEESLSEHLASCTQCQEYLAASTRVIAALAGFSFEVSPALQEKVCASISLRAQQIEYGQPSRRRMAWICLTAVLLSVAGSFIDLQFGGLLAAFLGMHQTQMRYGLFTFWILPSFCFLLLFPILPLLSHRKGRAL
jgi:anti-sigma factor RsiW